MAHTRHTDAVKAPDAVQAGGIILAGVGHALVDVDLAARSRESLMAAALEGAHSVHAAAPMLTGVCT